jgi:hypothetical protein
MLSLVAESDTPTTSRSSTVKKSLAAAGITLALILTGCSASQSPKQADRIEEDEAGWDCRTMGNGICGEDLPTGVVLLSPDECPLYVAKCYGHLTPKAGE